MEFNSGFKGLTNKQQYVFYTQRVRLGFGLMPHSWHSYVWN